jgi:hypothetical protein
MSRGAASRGAILGSDEPPREVSIDGVLYDRVGVDQAGHAYYAAETGTGYALAERPAGGVATATECVPHEAIGGFLEHVGERIGWNELADDWRDRADAHRGEDSAE